jgi:transposase-like protein
MPTRRMDMRQVRELMRLHREAGLGVCETARRVGIAESTMREMVKRFDRSGLEWPLAAALGNTELEAKLYGLAGVKPAVAGLGHPDGQDQRRRL